MIVHEEHCETEEARGAGKCSEGNPNDREPVPSERS
jgi:hypothetical protein